MSINVFDEKLEPGAAEIINAKPKIKPEENAYFYLVGLRAPLDREPGEFGRECITRLVKTSKSLEETSALYASGYTAAGILPSALSKAQHFKSAARLVSNALRDYPKLAPEHYAALAKVSQLGYTSAAMAK